jgi:tetratricopeptide (TPR) repeat protein
MANRNLGLTYRQLGDFAQAVATFEALIAAFGDDERSGVREQVAKAYLNLASTYRELGDRATETATLEALISRFGDDERPGVREAVAKAREHLIDLGE